MTAPLALSLPSPAQAQAASRTTYRVIVGDLQTGRVFSRSLPLTISTLSRRLNDVGSLSGTIRLDTATARKFAVVSKTTPRKTFLAVEVAQSIVWAGIIWPRDYTTSGHTMTVGASTLESILAHREIRDDLSFVQADRFAIARALVAYAQGRSDPLITAAAKQHAEAGIGAGANLQGVRSDRTQWTATSHKKILDALSELAATSPPFDFTIDALYDPAGRDGIAFTLSLGAPLGSSSAPWVFRYPGNVADYTWSEDGSSSANDVDAIGSGTGDVQPQSTRGAGVAQDDLDAGYPLLEDSATYDVESVDVLDSHARADAAAMEGDRVVCKASLAYSDAFAGWTLGDTARLMLTSPRHPALPNGAAGFDGTARLTGWDVTMPTPDTAGHIDVELEIA